MNLYDRIVKKPWPYWVGGVVLAVLNIILFALTGSPWRITTGFVYWGCWIIERLGYDAASWHYFSLYNDGLKPGQDFLNNDLTVINIAVIMGALISVLWASEFKWKKIKSKKQLIFALAGGFIMGYGTRLSFGCNIGSYLSAIPSFSLHGWVFGLSMFIGAWIGCRILYKYLI